MATAEVLRHLEQAKIAELADDLRQKGFQVERDARLGDGIVDILAENNGEKIAYEVKAAQNLPGTTGALRQLQKYAEASGVKDFRLIVVPPNRRIEIDIQQFDDELSEFLQNHVLSELDSLSSHTRIEGVVETNINLIEVTKEGIHVAGTSAVEVELNYGSGDDGTTSGDVFPLSFDLDLNRDLKIIQVRSLHADTSSFSE